MRRVTYTIEVHPEDIPVRGNAMSSGDNELDREVEDAILARLAQGEEWAWCTVEVIAHWGEHTGSAFLGGCSYKDKADFITDSDYYDDMCAEARSELEKGLRALVTAGQEAANELEELEAYDE